MTTRVLAAGDHFVLNRLLIDAVRERVPEGLEFTELTLDWPLVPFGRVAEVDEASGTEDQLIEALDGAEICLTQMAPLTRRVIEASPRLRLIGIGRGGPVNANLEAAAEHGVAVCCAPGRNAGATAEHTLGMILAAARRIPQTHAELTAGRWRSDYYRYDEVGIELRGSTIGLIGGGAVGNRVAEMLAALGAPVRDRVRGGRAGLPRRAAGPLPGRHAARPRHAGDDRDDRRPADRRHAGRRHHRQLRPWRPARLRRRL
jgi:D-3-phosphoglycerate dehydrogenase